MTYTETLDITIPDSYQLNAGTISEGRDRYTIVPPAVPMLDQLITHLDKAPLHFSDIQTRHLGVGLAALCVRWGSYLATLMDTSSEPHPAVAHHSPAQPNLARRPVRDIPLEHADRSLANTLACHAWRNTQIETIHAGTMPEPRLMPHQQRLTSREQRSVLREIAANFGAIYFLWDELFDQDFRDNLLPTWPESAKAMANSFYTTWASPNWSLVDASSAVTLYK